MDKFEPCGLLIDGVPLEDFGGAALRDYSVGETKITNTTFQGVNRSTFRVLRSFFGTRMITVTIVFKGETRHDAAKQRSLFNSAAFGASELYISDDGFFYSVALTSCGPEELVGEGKTEAQIKSKYQFEGIRHEALVRETVAAGGTIFCRSTVPFTDCKLTATPAASAVNYSFGGATFHNVGAGDVLVFDGIGGKITRSGNNDAASVDWTDFPRLVPGVNTISASSGTVVVEYYPTYL